MVEFDVVDAPDGRLVLGHSHEELTPDAVTLDEALRFLADQAPETLDVDLDLKWHGYGPPWSRRSSDTASSAGRSSPRSFRAASENCDASSRSCQPGSPTRGTGAASRFGRR